MSAVCRAARAGLVESFANSFSKDDVPTAADSNTTGLPQAEKAVEPRDERMTGSSDVSSLCCKVGFRVTLFPASGPTTGALRVASGWPKANISTMVPQTPHHRTASPRCILMVGVDGTGRLLLCFSWRRLAGVLHATVFLVEDSSVSNAAAVQCCCLVVPCCGGETGSSRPRSFHHAQPSTINARCPAVCSCGRAAAISTGAHDKMMRFGVWRSLQAMLQCG